MHRIPEPVVGAPSVVREPSGIVRSEGLGRHIEAPARTDTRPHGILTLTVAAGERVGREFMALLANLAA
jgi:hypothetical protein